MEEKKNQHIIPCPACGKEMLNWETVCPCCGAKRKTKLREKISSEEKDEFGMVYIGGESWRGRTPDETKKTVPSSLPLTENRPERTGRWLRQISLGWGYLSGRRSLPETYSLCGRLRSWR